MDIANLIGPGPQISSFVFIVGTVSFLGSFFIHLELWRTIKPRRQMALLGLIFVLAPATIYFALFVIAQATQPSGTWFVRDPFNLSYVFIWHLALSAAYIMSYPAIQAESPSLRILLAIADSRPGGLDARELEGLFPPDVLIKERFADLIAENLIQPDGNQYVPTRKGRALTTLFTGYRWLLDLPRGEG